MVIELHIDWRTLCRNVFICTTVRGKAFERFIKFAKNKVRVAKMCRTKHERSSPYYWAGAGCPRFSLPNTYTQYAKHGALWVSRNLDTRDLLLFLATLHNLLEHTEMELSNCGFPHTTGLFCICLCQASKNWFCACQNMVLNGHFLKVPAIFCVSSNFGAMCLLDNLADGAICGGLVFVFFSVCYIWNKLWFMHCH